MLRKTLLLLLIGVSTFASHSENVVEAIKTGEVETLVNHCKQFKTKKLSGRREMGHCFHQKSKDAISIIYSVSVDQNCQATEEVQAVGISEEYMRIDQFSEFTFTDHGVFVQDGSQDKIARTFSVDFKTGSGSLVDLVGKMKQMDLSICQSSQEVNDVVIIN